MKIKNKGRWKVTCIAQGSLNGRELFAQRNYTAAFSDHKSWGIRQNL